MEIATSMKDAIRLSEENRDEEALKKFDVAVESGFFDRAHSARAYCLQKMNFHLDAIDDFTKAIELDPDDSNLYFGRSSSYDSLGEFDLAIKDIEKAIELWSVKSPRNAQLEAIYMDRKLPTPDTMYPIHLEMYQDRKDRNEKIKAIPVMPPIRRNA